MREKPYTIKEMSEATGVPVKRIRYLIKKQVIEGKKIGWIWVFDQEQVDKLIEHEQKAKG